MEAIIFIGMQASGKSSFYFEHLHKTHLRLNLDMLKTRNRETILLEACIKAKQPLVIDNTNPTRLERKRYIGRLKQNRFRIKGYYFNASIEECIKRNNLREGKEKIPEAGIWNTWHRLEPPSYSEGFDELYSISIDAGGFKIEELKTT